ncbi:MAG: class I SAM-dependent methyltransferase [Anaerolineae bacterium]|nr:class I SAM-dependent methyltransferase [Anaerolineae bacterium]
MNEQDYAKFYDRVGKLIGWDFSNVKVECEGEMPDFYTEVSQKCTPSTILLDIGTGGGTRIAQIAKTARLLVGIDSSTSMVQTAKEKHPLSQYGNLRFFLMDATHLEFPEGFFDVVSCRQAPFNAQQAYQVLANGGWFLTQQVSEADKLNIKEVFGKGQYNEIDGTRMERDLQDLRAAGFTNIVASEYDLIEYYQTPDDLIFLLQHTPIIPNFGDNKQDFKILADFIDAHTTSKGIKTNSKRYIIVAKK